MAKIGKYAAILPKTRHIQHIFDSYEEAVGWMNNTSETGYIAVIVAEVVNKVEGVEASQELIDFAKEAFSEATPPIKGKE